MARSDAALAGRISAITGAGRGLGGPDSARGSAGCRRPARGGAWYASAVPDTWTGQSASVVAPHEGEIVTKLATWRPHVKHIITYSTPDSTIAKAFLSASEVYCRGRTINTKANGAEMALDPRDVGELQKSLNDAAGKASVLWTTFVTFELYLVISFGSVTHRDLFLETPIKLPVLNVDLPFVGFFVVAPAVLLILHFYVFLQLLALAAKSKDYDSLLRQEAPVGADRQYLRQRLDSFLVLQFLAGPKEQRTGFGGISLRLIAWLTLVGTPVLILLQGQMTFLPYHREWVVWLQRIVLIVDLGLIAYFWNRVRSDDDLIIPIVTSKAWVIIGAVLTLCVAVVSVCIATFPGELMHEHLPTVRGIPTAWWPCWSSKGDWTSLHELLFAGAPDEVSGQSRSLFSNRLVLTDQSFVDPEKLDKVNVSRSFRGRDLRQAVLNRADLRKADFTGAILDAAGLDGAKLQSAQFGCESNGPAQFDLGCTWLGQANLRGAQLEGANLYSAHLEGANLGRAQLQGANLNSAQLHGADLSGAQLQGADLSDAQLQGANLYSAQLQGANLNSAHLHGADLSGAQLQGADLSDARLQGANLYGTQLQGASLRNAYVWHARGTPAIDVSELNGVNSTEFPVGSDAFITWRDDILKVVASDQREAVKKRLSALDPDPAKEKELNDLIGVQFWGRASPAPSQLAAVLADLACRRKSAPYVARGLVNNATSRTRSGLFQDEATREKERIATVAYRLRQGKSDLAACPGVAGFVDKDWENLDALVEYLDAHIAAPKPDSKRRDKSAAHVRAR
jgi:uncharacterized protein YjbI with pentapeptide repeats